jgi:hypothetical protein
MEQPDQEFNRLTAMVPTVLRQNPVFGFAPTVPSVAEAATARATPLSAGFS